MTTITPDQVKSYHKTGYIHLKSILPTNLLELSQFALNRWTNKTISQWHAQGLIPSTYPEIDFQHRLLQAWHAAGKPTYSRSPRRDLVCPEMYQILVHPTLLDIAQALLGTAEISVHGIFNARPKLPDQKWTDTPWHQDAQYYRDAEETHVISMWYPLQRTTEENSCLQVAPGLHGSKLLEGAVDEESGFLGLSREESADLKGHSIEMDPGDVLCFPQKMPHRALPNQSEAVRWSMDVRYEATESATDSGRDKGFVVRSPGNSSAVESSDTWLSRWEGISAGTY